MINGLVSHSGFFAHTSFRLAMTSCITFSTSSLVGLSFLVTLTTLPDTIFNGLRNGIDSQNLPVNSTNEAFNLLEILSTNVGKRTTLNMLELPKNTAGIICAPLMMAFLIVLCRDFRNIFSLSSFTKYISAMPPGMIAQRLYLSNTFLIFCE